MECVSSIHPGPLPENTGMSVCLYSSVPRWHLFRAARHTLVLSASIRQISDVCWTFDAGSATDTHPQPAIFVEGRQFRTRQRVRAGGTNPIRMLTAELWQSTNDSKYTLSCNDSVSALTNSSLFSLYSFLGWRRVSVVEAWWNAKKLVKHHTQGNGSGYHRHAVSHDIISTSTTTMPSVYRLARRQARQVRCLCAAQVEAGPPCYIGARD